MNRYSRALPLLLVLPLLGGCLSLSIPFTKKPLETFEDVRGWTFQGRLLGLESTWVHLESAQGVPYTISIENFSKKEQARIRKSAKKLQEPPHPVRTAESSQVFSRNGQFIHGQDGLPFTGRILARNPYGQLTAKLSIYGGQLHGVCTYFWPDGQRQAEVQYDQGRLHGISVHWHSNGQVQSHGFHVNGGKDGLLETYHPNGRRQSRTRWNHGRPIGKHIQWHDNGHVSQQTLFQGGHPRSRQQWNAHGELIRLDRF